MKLGLRLFAVTVLALGLAVSAQALTITPASGVLNTSRWMGDQTSQSEINTAIAGIIGSSTELYKQDVGGPETGALATSYSTAFFNSATDPEDATITWVGGAWVGTVAYALVKDGDNSPAWYLFNLTTIGPWDGKDTLTFQDFWVGNGAISHVALYGTTSVPDGGSAVMLLGAALMGLAGVRRMLK